MRTLVLTCVLLSTFTCSQGPGFFVRDIKVIEPPGCLVPMDRAAVSRSSGMFDVAFRGNYIINALLEVTPQQARIRVTGAVVRLSFADGTSITAEDRTIPFSLIVETGDVAAVQFEAIPAGYLGTGDAGQRVIIEFRITAESGGLRVESPWFMYPVDTCNGCLVEFPPEAWDDECGGYNCNPVGPGIPERPCNLGQDDLVDCRLCSGLLGPTCWDSRCPCS